MAADRAADLERKEEKKRLAQAKQIAALERKEEKKRLAQANEAAKEAREQSAVQSKFVRLVDLLPPLPQKGEFDVNTIKSSLYFFS